MRIPHIGRSTTLWTVAIVILAYWAIVPFVAVEQLIEWVRSSQIVISTIVALVYLPSLIEILSARLPSQAQQLVLGVVVAWTFAAGNAGFFLLWRLAGKPDWMADSYVNGWLVWGMVIGALCHLTAPRTLEGEFPRETWIWLSVVFVLSITLAVYMLTSPPDARGLADWLRPYLG